MTTVRQTDRQTDTCCTRRERSIERRRWEASFRKRRRRRRKRKRMMLTALTGSPSLSFPFSFLLPNFSLPYFSPSWRTSSFTSALNVLMKRRSNRSEKWKWTKHFPRLSPSLPLSPSLSPLSPDSLKLFSLLFPSLLLPPFSLLLSVPSPSTPLLPSPPLPHHPHPHRIVQHPPSTALHIKAPIQAAVEAQCLFVRHLCSVTTFFSLKLIWFTLISPHAFEAPNTTSQWR